MTIMKFSQLIEILACPDCKTRVKYIEDKAQLQCIRCGQAFEISHGVPIMLNAKAKAHFNEMLMANPKPGSIQRKQVSLLGKVLHKIAVLLSPPSPRIYLFNI